VVKSNAEKATHELFSTGRWCEVLPSEFDSRVAITDWAGSNCAEIYIIDLSDPDSKRLITDLLPELLSSLSRSEAEGHVYWEALAWKSAGVLQIRVFGHTDEESSHAFRLSYTVNVDAKTFVAGENQRSEDWSAEEDAWNSKASEIDSQKEMPTKALVPTATSGTFPAGEPPRQP
jgi:hypothetical protein